MIEQQFVMAIISFINYIHLQNMNFECINCFFCRRKLLVYANDSQSGPGVLKEGLCGCEKNGGSQVLGIW